MVGESKNASYFVQKCDIIEQNIPNQHLKISKKQVLYLIQQIWCNLWMCFEWSWDKPYQL